MDTELVLIVFIIIYLTIKNFSVPFALVYPYREDGHFIQDVLFYCFFATDLAGVLIEKTEYQENFWATREELFNSGKYDLFDGLVCAEYMEPKPLEFVESVAKVEGY